MNGRRVFALFRRVAEEIRRDRPSLALLFIAPIVLTGLITFILREGSTPTVTAVIVNQSGAPGSAVAGALAGALRDQGSTATIVSSEGEARVKVQDGSASVAIVLPSALAPNGPRTITVITNGLDPSAEAAQLGAVQKAVLLGLSNQAGAVLPTFNHVTIYGKPTGDQITSYAPAIVGFFAYFFVYLLTGVSFLRERTGGTLERLMATPVTRAEVVVGYTLGFGLFATIQVVILMCWALGSIHVPAIGPLPEFSIGLGIPMAGNPLIAFLSVVLLAVGAVSLGIFLSTFARTELQIIQFIPLVLVPQFLLSGVLFPVSSLPDVLRPLVPLMPLNYAVDGLRQVFIRGADLTVSQLQQDLIVLGLVALFFGTIASLTIRREVV
jgi:ABC-2 type transport system permease protein